MMTYFWETIQGLDGSEFDVLKRKNIDGSISNIPKDEANSDYQAYLAWKAEQ